MKLHPHSEKETLPPALHIAPDADLEELHKQGELQNQDTIALEFPTFTDGRAFSQAVLLRRRYNYRGDIRATGDVLIDQLTQMSRSGFTSAVLIEGANLEAAQKQLQRYKNYYQGDINQPRPHFSR